ncbi:putative Endonuclease-reverse transcriptase [Trypanosoma cruzi]|uniref:Putative Endonuclease-reverse transcriptase n=1 Tax=Trypanosoma cruzi TaxID=5693 RepID=A0A2V2WBB5_TRYCR|nr:putative Endonuclease-reverse transcriptase [Trypanosoma cruzi]
MQDSPWLTPLVDHVRPWHKRTILYRSDMVKAFDCADWSASVSPLSDHYMLTFTLHQAFKDTIPSAPPSAPKFFYSWGKCKWDLFIRTSTHNFRHTTIKSSPPALRLHESAYNFVSTALPPRHAQGRSQALGRHSHGAERIATDSKARYLQLPTPDREAEMQRTMSQFFLLLRERLRNTYLRRISKLNPGEPLARKYISGRKKASLPSPHQCY